MAAFFFIMKTQPLSTFLLAVALLGNPVVLADMENATPAITTVFESGTDGYHTYRIPALVTAANGDLLAFAEGRVDHERDNGNIDLVLRRSSDEGETWSALQVVGDLGSKTYGNPVPIVTNDGTIHLVTNSNDGADAKHGIRAGTSNDIRRVHYQKSTDHGNTWTAPVEITTQVTKAGEDWRWYATGPCHGIQLKRGPHAGRLIVPCDHSDHSFKPGAEQDETNAAHIIYSDDNGATWQVGGEIHRLPGSEFSPWESTVVELTDGRLLLNTRNHASDLRINAFSYDGGESFGPMSLAKELIEPGNHGGVQGALLRYSATDQGATGNRLLFSNPAASSTRRRITVRSSSDEGATWSSGRVIHADLGAYTDMARLDSGKIGLLNEAGETFYHDRIDYVSFTPQWLDEATALTVAEDFDPYPVGETLGGKNSGQGFALSPGWSAPSGGTINVAAGNHENGNEARVSPVSQTTSSIRDLCTDYGQDGTTTYIGVTLQNLNAGTRFFGLTLLRDFDKRLLIGGKDSLFYSIGLGSERVATTVPSTDRKHLVVRIDSRPGNDKISLFVNPGQSESATALATLTSLDLGMFNQISIGAGSEKSDSTTVEASFDHIMIGSSFNQVSSEGN